MRIAVGMFVVASTVAFAQKPDPEVVQLPPLDLPAVPSFDLPPSEPGFVSVPELRVRAKKYLDTEVKAKGYIIWIYNCVDAVRTAGESRAKAQKRIDDDPTLCERRKFYLGESKQTPLERGLWVVSVPRPPNKLEKERLPKEELKAWPKVPKLRVGDYVVVTGKFALSSPHSERNSDGLLVFAAIEPAKKAPVAKRAPATPVPRPPVAAPATKQVVVDAKDKVVFNASIKASNEGTKLFVARKYDDAIAAYTRAVQEWPGNHVAFYGLAGAQIGKKAWSAAADAMAKAVELEPGEAMYNMVYGYTLYEGALAQATEAEARKQGRKPEEVIVDRSKINNDKALVHLTHATTINPALWRAHYYIGRIYRDRGDARWAAESFDLAVRSGPPDPGPYVALVELYRGWGHTDQAIAVAKAGTTRVVDVSDVWYVLGMSYDDKRQDKQAIESFTKAIDARPDNGKALFQRGQAYFRTRDFAKAKIDLEAFTKAGHANDFAKVQASKMLMDIAANKR